MFGVVPSQHDGRLSPSPSGGVFGLVLVYWGVFLLFQFPAVFSLVAVCCTGLTASKAHILAASQPHTFSPSVYCCHHYMYLSVFVLGSQRDVDKKQSVCGRLHVKETSLLLCFSLVSVCCGVVLLFQFAVVTFQ